MKKRILSLILTATMIFTMLPVTLMTSADDTAVATATASGMCGDNVEWSVTDGCLTISGEGDMYDYTYVSSSDVPWYSYKGSITKLVIEDGVTSIGGSAFNNMYAMTTATIGNSVVSIGNYAFEDCYELKKINIPASVEEIGMRVFSGCEVMTIITVDEDNNYFTSKRGVLYNKDMTTLIQYPLGVGGSFAIPDGVETIGMCSFASYCKLWEITIPASVTTIEDSAFLWCDWMTDVYYEGTREQWENVYVGGSNDGIENATLHCADDIIITEDEGTFGDNLTWKLNDEGTLTISGEGAMPDCAEGNVIYSDEIPWYDYTDRVLNIVIEDGVTNIGAAAFYDCYNATSVTIPDSVTSIGAYAFRYCESVSDIAIPGAVTEIGNSAFSGCSSLTSITIPEGVTAIESNTFNGCYNLTSITLLGDITSIGSQTFRDCDKLTDITIPDSVTEIGNGAFYSCDGMTSITIPAGVTSIEYCPFTDCQNLTYIDVDANNQYYTSYNGDLYTKDMTTLIQYANGKEDTSFTIPESVTTIGRSAFLACDNLTEIIIPDNVTTIETGAFRDCQGLTSIEFPNSVTTIPVGCFEYCTNLKSITIPVSVTKVESNSIYWCDSLTDVYYGGTEEQWKNVSIANWNEDLTNATIHFTEVKEEYVAEGTCGDNLIWTLDDAGKLTIKYGISAVSYTASVSETSNASGAMANYPTASDVPWYSYLSDIKSIVVEEGVTSIGTNALRDCPNLTSVSLPNSLVTIGYGSFRNDTALTSIVIPDSVTTISSYVFYGCSALESVKLPSSITTINDFTFYLCKKLKSIDIPEKVKTIGASAFRGCSALTEVTIPVNVTTINGGAFSYCPKLATVTMNNKVTTIGNNAFASCGALKNINYEGTQSDWSSISIGTGNDVLTSATITYGKTDCVSYGTCGTDLEWVLDYDGVLTISGTGTMTSYASASAVPWYSYADSITSIVVKDGVTTIGSWAFYLLKKVTSVSLPEGLTTIGSSAFRGCSALTEITIPSTVTTIGSAAISYCSKLATVIMYNGVKTIGNNAFVSCSALKTVNFKGTEEEWNAISVGTNNDKLTGATINYDVVVTVELSYIEIATLPTKLVYEIGEEFDRNGMVVNAVYSDGTKVAVDDYNVTGFDSTTAGTKEVVVSYGGKELKFQITIDDYSIEKVVITKMPAKTTYFVGEELDLTGLVVNVTFTNGNTITLDNTYVTAEGFDSSKPGICSFNAIVEYEGKTHSFAVQVMIVELTISNIEIATLPSKTDYYVGEELDLTGLTVKAVYNNGNVEEITDYTVSGFDSETAGTKTITVEYEGFTAQFEVVVRPKTEGECGDNLTWRLDATGTLIISGTGEMYEFSSLSETPWNDVRSEVLSVVINDGVTTIGNCAFEHCDSLVSITIPESVTLIRDRSILGCDVLTSIEVDVNNQYYTSLDGNLYNKDMTELICYAIGKPDTTFEIPDSVTAIGEYAFCEGDFLTNVIVPDGLTTIWNCAFYGCDNLTSITIPDSVTTIEKNAFYMCYSLTDAYYRGTQAEWNEIYVGFNSQLLKVLRCIEKIEIVTIPNKTEYKIGEELDLSGLIVNAVFDNGESFEITDYTVSGFDSTTPGIKTVTVEYKGLTAQFDVEVIAEIIGIELTLPNKTEYYVGEEFDPEGMIVWAVWDYGLRENVTGIATVSGFDSYTEGVKTITVEYAGFTSQFDVTVINGTPVITVESVEGRIGGTVDVSISIENNPGIAGLQLELNYDERLTLSNIVKGDALSGLNFTVPGDLTQNTLVLPLDGMDADNTNGIFLTLTFIVPEDAVIGDVYGINVSYNSGSIYDADLNDVECDIVNGRVMVGYTLGDVNSDGNINVQDVITLRRGVAGGYGITLNQAADLNYDGIYSVKDVTMLRRYIVGGYGVEL